MVSGEVCKARIDSGLCGLGFLSLPLIWWWCQIGFRIKSDRWKLPRTHDKVLKAAGNATPRDHDAHCQSVERRKQKGSHPLAEAGRRVFEGDLALADKDQIRRKVGRCLSQSPHAEG